MKEFSKKISIIIRAQGERTEGLCRILVENQIDKSKFHERHFSIQSIV